MRAGALAGMIAPLPHGDPDAGIALPGGLHLVVDRAAALHDPWTPASPVTISHSAIGPSRATLIAADGRVGLDMESLDRVALNAEPDDRWLAPWECALVAAAADSILELACHWLLKEAYGKAIGRGLALPLDALAFGVVDGTVVLRGSAAPTTGAGWRFSLYRQHATLFGVAHQPSYQPTPFAPDGRNPPTPLRER